MSLRTRLTLAFLILALVPSLLVSAIVLRQLVSTIEWWDNAGVEDALTSSVSVAKSALKRMEGGLHVSADRLFEMARSRPLDLAPEGTDRLFIRRYLKITGLDVFQIYRWNAADSAWALDADVPPEGVLRAKTPDLGPELTHRSVDFDRPAQSSTGMFALLAPGLADSASLQPPVVAVGYMLPEDFFGRLSELSLGLATFRQLAVFGAVFKSYFRIVVLLLLVAVTILAFILGSVLARHLTDPISDLSESLARVDGGTEVRVVPRGAPEVRRLGNAFNAMTARLVQARRDLARAERAAAWQGVARQVAHEIKNPLTTIGLALYNMEREFDRLPSEARAHAVTGLASLRRELDALTDLAESFAALGTLPATVRGRVDLNAVVEGIAASSPWPHVALETRLDPARPMARGDERQLRRSLRNLVKNACEAQPSGGRVVLSTRADAAPPAAAGAGATGAAGPVAAAGGAFVALEVSDDGPGMPPEVLAHAFDPDFSTKGRGSGVGLAVTRNIVEQHGGAILVDSAPGRGTRVTLVLPAAAPDAAPDPAPDLAPDPAPDPAPDATKHTREGHA